MPAQKLSALFSATDTLARLSQASAVVAELQSLYANNVPANLARFSRVIGRHKGLLLVGADNNAAAAKIRLLTPPLLKAFQTRGGEVTGIRVVLQVGRAASATQPKRPNKTLPIDLIDKIIDRATPIRDARLRAAIERFANHRRGR